MIPMIRKLVVLNLFLACSVCLFAQVDRWQQRVQYEMQIDFDVSAHTFEGYQKLKYFNNSPDTLDRLFYHLYFNAFQPNSMMDVRARSIPDPDPRIGNRIAQLNAEDQGFHEIKKMRQNGDKVKYAIEGTIMEVQLDQHILPGKSTEIEIWFHTQIPVQIRRSGRYNREGVAYSMSQWYPKVCEYDYRGWHAYPYIQREFHGVWGDFDVHIHIDKEFTLGGTGVLQNAEQVGKGYAEEARPIVVNDKLHWHFRAENVHDFMWAADPAYTHKQWVREDGLIFHYLYKEDPNTRDWELLPEIMAEVSRYLDDRLIPYPYPQYSIIQGGDGGMEYPMGTLITGHRKIKSLVGVCVHEYLHAWFQGILANNESLYPWLDEGFTNYFEEETMNHLMDKGLIPGFQPVMDPHKESFNSYKTNAKSGVDEPLSTYADYFNTNMAHNRASYTRGQLYLNQIRYVVGEKNFEKGIRRYCKTWQYKHPEPNDFRRVMEKVSGIALDWLENYLINTTFTIDYAIDSVTAENKTTVIHLSRVDRIPMPVDVAVNLLNGKIHYYTIPLRVMRGAKLEDDTIVYELAEDWPWTHTVYELHIPEEKSKISKIILDPSQRMADIDRTDNVWRSD